MLFICELVQSVEAGLDVGVTQKRLKVILWEGIPLTLISIKTTRSVTELLTGTADNVSDGP